MRGREVAKEYLSYDLNPVPLKDKVAQRKGWRENISLEEIDKYDFSEIGICTGIPSGGLEVIDFDIDSKPADEQKAIMRTYQDKVGGELINKLVIQKTLNGGYHLIYRCSVLEGNRVLAKSSDGQTLIETRGDGGYIKCFPSKGYTITKGDLSNIPIISPVERNRLLAAAHRLDEESFVKHRKRKKEGEEFSKFPKYDNDASIGLALLEKHGWRVFDEDAKWVNFIRPGKDESSSMSGGYNLEKNFLFLFTTSTVFESMRPYNNVGIYAMLECDGDFKVAYARLGEQGYGTQKPKKVSEEETDYDFSVSLESLSFLSSADEESQYLMQAAENKIPQGLSTGWVTLDEHFRFKSNTMNFGLGYDGVGKSLFLTSLMVSSNILHDWVWAAIMPENKVAMNRLRIMEAYAGHKISYLYRNPKIFERYKRLAYDNFHMVANRQHWSLKDVIEMGKRLHEYHGVNALLIDPYNFFKVGGSNGYSWNNDILSQLRVFAERHCSVYVMAHPNSDSPRTNVDDKGFLKPPKSYEIQGGADFPYRVDDFFVIHRIKNHPDKEIRNTMQFIAHKIKEEETGGKVHSAGDYTGLEWKISEGFAGYWDEKGNNPMFNWKKNQSWAKENKEETEDNNFLKLL